MNRNNLFEWSESEGQLFTTLITQMGGLYTDNPQGEYKANEIDSFINEASGVAYTNLTSPNGYSKSGNIVFGKGFVEDNPSPDPKMKTPFYVENIGTETNTFGLGFKDVAGEIGLIQFTFEISEDGQTWIEHTIDTSSPWSGFFTTEFTEKIYVRANTTSYCVLDEEMINGYSIMIGCMNPFNVGGNTMSLLYGSDFTGDETVFPQGSTLTFGYLFSEMPLVSAKDLILPATTLSFGCYGFMFMATQITKSPELPATSLAPHCYSYMFNSCELLTSAPELPATTLAEGCYESMFFGCTSLIKAPELPATRLSDSCYQDMFQGCTSLESVTVHVEGEWNTENTASWLDGVASEGTLYNLGDANGIPENDSSGCPYGWTIETTAPGPEPPHPETLDYFWITPEEDAKIVVKFGDLSYCDYSIDQVLWKSLWDDDLIIPANTKIYLRANTINEHQWSFSVTKNNSENVRFNVGGNIMSLVYSKNFVKNTEFPAQDYSFGWFFTETSVVDASELVLPANYLTVECYAGMFSDCTSLVSAPELPATELANGCYRQMFADCTSLTSAPELPATTLSENCYYSMFKDCTSLTITPNLLAQRLADYCCMYMFDGCTSLTTAHELPSTELANSCYECMFQNCTSLTNIPSILPATTLTEGCYLSMFADCTSLTSAPELKGTELVNGCYSLMFFGCTLLNSVIIHIEGSWTSIDSSLNWLYNVAPSGTIHNLGGATGIPTDDISGCPSGWTVVSE